MEDRHVKQHNLSRKNRRLDALDAAGSIFSHEFPVYVSWGRETRVESPYSSGRRQTAGR